MTHRLMLARVILALSILTLCLAGCAFVKEWSQPASTAVPTLAQDPLEAMQVIEERVSDSLEIRARTPGCYRIVATRTYAGRRRGWIYSNPIWVEE